MTATTVDDTPLLGPLALWGGILAGPVAWALDLTISYALVKWTCATQRTSVLHLITLLSLATVGLGVLVAWRSLRQTAHVTAPGQDQARQRARFMATLGLASSGLFAIAIVAGAIPEWLIDACQ
jgi:hypothetical protein